MKENLLTFLAILFFFNCYTYPQKEEVVQPTTSSFIYVNKELNDSIKKAELLFNKEDYKKSLQTSFNTLKQKEKLSKYNFIKLNTLIGNIFFKTKNYKKAVHYFNKSLNFKSNNLEEESFSYKNNEIYLETFIGLGNSYYRLSREPNNSKKLDSSLYYYNKIIDFESNNLIYKEFKARAYTNLSVIFKSDSLLDISKEYALKAIDIHKELKNKANHAAALGNLSNIYLLEGNFNKAKEIYFSAIDLVKDIKTDEALKIREDLYYNLAWNLYLLKDYKAYDYQELSFLIRDSIQEKQFRQAIAEINDKFNFDVKKRGLIKEQENKRLKEQRKFLIAGSVLVFLIFSLLYFVNFYKLKQKNLSLELSKSELEQNKRLEKLRSDSQTRILNATIDGKESERKQIAETLHDSVSALLSSANLHLQATKKVFNGKTPVEIDKTREIITEASQKIRDLSHTLVSSVLLKFGLKFAIKDMASKYSNSQISFKTNIGKVRRYHQDFEIKVYNITQEFLNNILKHSKASKATIHLQENENSLYLKVVDNGVGFDKEKVISKDGLGINQIEARVIVMGGYLDINSTIGKGTEIIAQIPIQEKEINDLV